ncbi:hypothetical protein HDF24_19590 [Mucilaginibacter sp. X4EP1]|uniref:hypothetical protein n=1 Tax=Mucilaginibacter sp. X4EP1 TaxID=2723092 RepID=UPI00216A1F66|nr:hypothetical protein [Mucilaginibacter sp. X4EP1]MCS3812831.1 hypothetical protein [Mucilaginibacter sp. X4EP1]
MKIRASILVLSLFLNLGYAGGLPNKDRDYKFSQTISRPVLENYLDRSITMQNLLTNQNDFDDNLRMIKNIGAKFIGRAVCQWGGEAHLMQNFELEKQLALKIHKADPDIILQACIFENVTDEINQIAVPAWTFTALGMPVEQRNFRYDDILYADGMFKNKWGNGSVPDVSRPETKLLFYFLAVSYINAGIEGIHFGQVELMNKNDKNLDNYAQVLGLIRAYAHQHARRRIVICDAHVPGGGFVRDGKLLLDVHAFPLRIMETPEEAQDAVLKVGYTDALYLRSKGGITPSGWQCDHLPYLVEFDNYGGSDQPGQAKAAGSFFWVWGYDEISWFANQSKPYRTFWLHYAYNWIHKTDINGHLEMPGSRQTSKLKQMNWYHANNQSPAMPKGLGDENTIRDIWAAADLH